MVKRILQKHAVGAALAIAIMMPQPGITQTGSTKILPLSDQDNSDGWVLNKDVSDEFNNGKLDRNKWHAEGTNGQYHHWKGRAPSQFVGRNALVEDGKLKIRTKWEPDFEFANETAGGKKYGDKLPVTTAAVIGKKRFLYGYMEARTKAGNAAMTSAFWALGHQSELDVYEQIGNPKRQGNIREDYYTSAIHDWRPGRYVAQFGKNKTFTNTYKMDSRVADGFHVYGCEWDEDYLKFYLNGKLIKQVSRREIGDGWVLSNPLAIWFDSEIFDWLGNPHKEELPVDYEIDYVRIWQKPDPNLLDRALFGFEGPIVPDVFITDKSTNVARKQKGRLLKNWAIGDKAKEYFSIAENNFFMGYRSLRFKSGGTMDNQVTSVSAPEGSAQIPAGTYELSMRLWIKPDTSASTLRMGFKEENSALAPISISKLERGRWVEVTQRFNKKISSSEKDHLFIAVTKNDAGTGSSEIYLDELKIVPFEK